MKYISRFAALLMALMLLVGSAGALTLDNLTEDELAGLYQAAAENASVTYMTDVLGWTATPSVENGESLAASGMTFQWYEIIDGNRAAIEGATSYAYEVTFTLEEKRYQCLFYDEQGNAYQSNVFVVCAQTIDLYEYCMTLYTDYDNLYWTPCAPLDAYMEAAYNWMQTWNVTLADGSNLAENVLAYWMEYPDTQDLLRSCAGEDAEFCINSPDAAHPKTCGWYTGTPVIKLGENEDGSYTLYTMVNAQEVVLAVSELMDGHHYFRDVREGEAGLYVAWLYIDDEGNPWLMPLESQRATPAE